MVMTPTRTSPRARQCYRGLRRRKARVPTTQRTATSRPANIATAAARGAARNNSHSLRQDHQADHPHKGPSRRADVSSHRPHNRPSQMKAEPDRGRLHGVIAAVAETEATHAVAERAALQAATQREAAHASSAGRHSVNLPIMQTPLHLTAGSAEFLLA